MNHDEIYATYQDIQQLCFLVIYSIALHIKQHTSQAEGY